MRVSPRVRRDMRTSASCPSSRTTRSWIGAGAFDGGADAGAVTADAGTGAAVAGAAAGVAVATGVGCIYMLSGASAPDAKQDTPDPTVGAGKISGFRGWCHVTSRECTTLSVSAFMILKQSLRDGTPACRTARPTSAGGSRKIPRAGKACRCSPWSRSG